jgi:GLPGLI family protein
MLGLAQLTLAQQLVLQGKIVFERKENMHKLIQDEQKAEDEPSTWYEEMLKIAPKYRIDQFELAFNTTQTMYKMTLEDEAPFNQRWFRVAYKNTVYTSLNQRTFVAEKNVFEKDYRIEDSLPSLKWKLTNEYREIAGKNCRKATTILFDSIYVIAFYTNEIPVSSGPELFNGLPGMILGIVIPRIHYTLFATSVQNTVVTPIELQVPAAKRKSKPIPVNEYTKELLEAFKDWEDYAGKLYWRAMF